jgi:hypothetical protein
MGTNKETKIILLVLLMVFWMSLMSDIYLPKREGTLGFGSDVWQSYKSQQKDKRSLKARKLEAAKWGDRFPNVDILKELR